MGDRWGSDGPSPEAYSRVTRDLREVTAGFAAYLDDLANDLAARFDCRVRPASAAELGRLRRGDTRSLVEDVESYAVEPAAPEAATLLVRRYVQDDATSVTLAAGVDTRGGAPTCLCDACDEDSQEMVAAVDEFVAMVTSRFREFRSAPVPGSPAAGRGALWQEHGCVWSGGHSVSGSPGDHGPAYDASWAPWPARSRTAAG